jgi:molecular chaperone GrpE
MKKIFEIKDSPILNNVTEGTPIDHLSSLLRAKIDLENKLETFTLGTERDKEKLFLELFEVTDSLQRILSQNSNTSGDPSASDLLESIRITLKQLLSVLRRRDVLPFDTLESPADPALTEIAGVDERADCDDDIVIKELQKGYKYKDRVLRRASVIIAVRKGG